MARTPDVAAARTVRVMFRITPEEAAVLDRKRGRLSRSAYLRDLFTTDLVGDGRTQTQPPRPSLARPVTDPVEARQVRKAAQPKTVLDRVSTVDTMPRVEPHRHRRGRPVHVRFYQGARQVQKACEDPDCDWISDWGPA